MKGPVIIFAIVTVVAILGLGAYRLSQNSSPSDSMVKKEGTYTAPTDAVMNDKLTSSRYVQYSKSTLDSSSDTRRVLFFYASWCPTCRPADTSFSQNVSRIPNDVTLIRVNYNDLDTDQDEKNLAKKYGVTYQHTFVQIDSTGNEVAKWNGGQIAELLTNIK